MLTSMLVIQIILVGCSVGIISNALGLGGGIVMVPAFMLMIPGIDAHTAKGSSLFIIVFVSAYNAWRLQRSAVNRQLHDAAALAVGSVLGAFLAGWGTQFLTQAQVGVTFALFALLTGLRIFFAQEPQVAETEVRTRAGLSMIIGFAAGVVSGATGVGGGAILVPLALMAGIVSNARAVAMSNTVMVLTSLSAALAHFSAAKSTELAWTWGQVNVALAPLVLFGAFLGAPAGRWLNVRLTFQRRRAAMGALLLFLAGSVLWRTVMS